jgi:hypothetical protein
MVLTASFREFYFLNWLPIQPLVVSGKSVAQGGEVDMV